MTRKSNGNITEELIKAFHDDGVRSIIGALLDDKLKFLVDKVDHLSKENDRKTAEIAELNMNLAAAYAKVEDLEAYTRRENLIITGLPISNAAEATKTPAGSDERQTEHATETERAVLTLCQNMNVPISSTDISVTHRLRKIPNIKGPPAVIVRFTNRKARDAVYAARKTLKSIQDTQLSYPHPVYINEDLTKQQSHLFSEARKLVKSKIISNTWTSQGHVYIKINPLAKPKLIQTASELPHC